MAEQRIPLLKKTKDDDEADDNHPSFLNKLWRKFTTPSSSSSGSQLFLAYCYFQGYPRIFITDVGTRKVREAGLVEAFKGAQVASSSCNGLILLTCRQPVHHHVVFNPMSNRIATRIIPLPSGGSPCGFFFHPLAKEYRLLNVREILIGSVYEYCVYLSGPGTWRKAFAPNFHSQPLLVSRGAERFHCLPTVTSEALFWYHSNREIMIFDIVTEEMCFKPPPGAKKDVWRRGILAKEDRLVCCNVHAEQAVMHICVLECYASWSWERKHTVNLVWDAVEYPLLGGGSSVVQSSSILQYNVKVVSIQGDEVVLCWKHRGVFSYHLGKKTVERVRMNEETVYDNLLWGCGLLPFAASPPEVRVSRTTHQKDCIKTKRL